MKKVSILLGFAILSFTAVDIHAQGIDVGGFQVQKQGLSFTGLMLTIDPQKMTGTLAFSPNNPQAAPANSTSPYLPKGNTVEELKEEIAEQINKAIKQKKLIGYNNVRKHDVAIYGGTHINSQNSFADRTMLEVSPKGMPYKVTVKLTSKDIKHKTHTFLQGNFTIMMPVAMAAPTAVKASAITPAKTTNTATMMTTNATKTATTATTNK